MNKGLGLAVAGLAALAIAAAVWLLAGSEAGEAGAEVATLRAEAGAPDRPAGFESAAAPEEAPAAVQLVDTSRPASGGESRPATAASAAPAPRPQGPAVAVTGRVLDEAGRPVAGASVTFLADPLAAALALRPGAARPAVAALPEATSGADGRFSIEARLRAPDEEEPGFLGAALQPQLVVRHEAFATLAQSFSNPQPPRLDAGDLVLAAGAWIVGRAVDENGRPVAGARASARNTGDDRGPRGFLMPFGGAGDQLGEVVTAADGRFRVSGLAPGRAELSVRADGRRLGFVGDLELQARQPADAGDVPLPLGQSIAGVVLDDQGRPIEGAEVSVSSMARIMVNRIEDLPRGQIGQEFGQVARTDAAGRFEVSGLGGGHYTVHAQAEGYAEDSRPDVPAGTRDVRLQPARLGGLFVQVVSEIDGLPVAGARIKATQAPVGDQPFRRFEDGRRLPVLSGAEALSAAGREGDPAGAYYVRHAGIAGTHLVVAADGFATLELDAAAVAAGAQGELAVRLVPESVVAGRVVDSEGRPLADARVALSVPEPQEGRGGFAGPGRRAFSRGVRLGGPPEDGAEDLDARRRSTHSAADGSFEIRGAAPGDWQLAATHPDCVDGTPLALTLGRGEQRRDLVLALAPAGVLLGTVTEHDGTPAADIEVSVRSAAAAAPAAPADEIEVGIGRIFGEAEEGRHFARTDDQGRWRLGGLPAGEYQVALSSSSRRPRRMGGGMVFAFAGDRGDEMQGPATWVKVEAGGETRVDLVRPQRGSLRGRVLAGGQPVPDTVVSLRQGGGRAAFLPRAFGGGEEARTDDRGEFRFDDVEAGTWELSASVTGAPIERTATVELGAGEARSADLLFGGVTLAGRVVDREDGGGAADVLVTAVPVESGGGAPAQQAFAVSMVMIGGPGGGGGGMTMELGGGPASQIRTDAEGRFELKWMEPGSYRLEASGGGYANGELGPVEVLDGQAQDDLRIEVDRGAVVHGAVVSGETGQRLDGVPVRLEGADTRMMEVTEQGGRFRFEGLAPGRYTVSALGSGMSGFGDLGDAALASEDVELQVGEQRQLDLTTARGG